MLLIHLKIIIDFVKYYYYYFKLQIHLQVLKIMDIMLYYNLSIHIKYHIFIK